MIKVISRKTVLHSRVLQRCALNLKRLYPCARIVRRHHTPKRYRFNANRNRGKTLSPLLRLTPLRNSKQVVRSLAGCREYRYSQATDQKNKTKNLTRVLSFIIYTTAIYD